MKKLINDPAAVVEEMVEGLVAVFPGLRRLADRAEGIPVEKVIVADDVALAASAGHAGRRGLAGTILVHKIAGAVAESGAPLTAVAAAARAAAAAVRTMGLALSSCTVPAAGRPGFTLAETEIELGLGIHGEPGVRRGPVEPADVLVDCLLDAILADRTLAPGARVVLLINNLGATPTMELAVVARRAVAVLESRGAVVERAYLGTFLSALDMAGVSLSVLPIDDERLAHLDAPTDAPAWPNAAARPRRPASTLAEPPPSSRPAPPPPPNRPRTPLGLVLESAIVTATQALIEASPRLTEMDQVVGDGDLGISLERGSRAVRQDLPAYPLDDSAATLRALAVTLQQSLGGTSGPLYAAFFLRASAALDRGAADDAQNWATAFRAGCTATAELGGAEVGDRTMLDALQPAAAAFQAAVSSHRLPAEALRSAADAAADGVRATAQMVARRGRSSYLGERVLGYPDPGAEAVAVVLEALVRGWIT